MQSATETTETYYSRDAQGNTLSTYTTVTGAAFTQESVTLYGSARLGEYRPHEQDANPAAKSLPAIAEGLYYRKRGYVHYELTNHLGNVLATVSDRKLISTSSFYVADIVSLQDYYAFGMTMPERTYNADAYRYSINGQEKDTDIDASGNHTTALYWEYDSRIGRRWNLDPIPNTGESPYVCFSDNPIRSSDVKGDTPIETTTETTRTSTAQQSQKTGSLNKVAYMLTSTTVTTIRNAKTGVPIKISELTQTAVYVRIKNSAPRLVSETTKEKVIEGKTIKYDVVSGNTIDKDVSRHIWVTTESKNPTVNDEYKKAFEEEKSSFKVAISETDGNGIFRQSQKEAASQAQQAWTWGGGAATVTATVITAFFTEGISILVGVLATGGTVSAVGANHSDKNPDSFSGTNKVSWQYGQKLPEN